MLQVSGERFRLLEAALGGGYEDFTYAGIGINCRHHFIGPGAHALAHTAVFGYVAIGLTRSIASIN